MAMSMKTENALKYEKIFTSFVRSAERFRLRYRALWTLFGDLHKGLAFCIPETSKLVTISERSKQRQDLRSPHHRRTDGISNFAWSFLLGGLRWNRSWEEKWYFSCRTILRIIRQHHKQWHGQGIRLPPQKHIPLLRHRSFCFQQGGIMRIPCQPPNLRESPSAEVILTLLICNHELSLASKLHPTLALFCSKRRHFSSSNASIFWKVWLASFSYINLHHLVTVALEIELGREAETAVPCVFKYLYSVTIICLLYLCLCILGGVAYSKGALVFTRSLYILCLFTRLYPI